MAQILKTLNVPGMGKSLNTWFEQIPQVQSTCPGVTAIALVVLEAMRNEIFGANIIQIHGTTALSDVPGVIDSNVVSVQNVGVTSVDDFKAVITGVTGVVGVVGITGVIDANIVSVQGEGVTSVDDFKGTSSGTTGGTVAGTTSFRPEFVDMKIQKLFYPLSES